MSEGSAAGPGPGGPDRAEGAEEAEGGRPSMTRYVVRHRVLFNILFFVCMLAGIFAVRRMPVDAYPNVDLDAAVISTVWIGSSAEEVDTLVTVKIEEELQGIRGVDRIISDSRPNRSSILIKFIETLSDSELDRAFQDIRAAIERIDDLPAETEKPVLTRQTVFEIFPLISIGVGYDRPEREAVARSVARELREELLAIDGVAKVQDRDLREPEVQVLVDPERAERHDVTLEEIVRRLRATNRNVPAGELKTASGGEIGVKAAGNYLSTRDVEETVVREDASGAHVRVRDVARVVRGFEKRDVRGRFRGRDALILPVSKDEGRNSLSLVDEVRELLDRFVARGIPQGIDIGVALDSSQIIRDRLSVLLGNLAQGVLLVFGVLCLGVGFRNSLLAIVGIPFSFLVAFLCMNAMGVSINAISLFALVLVSGVDVDDAIVVLENIHRRREEGLPLREAVIAGTQEVLGAVFNSTMTTVAAFLPMLLTVGVVGEFFSIIPKVVAAVLLGSLFQCFFMLPVHVLDLGGPAPLRAKGSRLPGLRGFVARAAAAGMRAYERALSTCIRHRYAVLVVLLASAVLANALWLGLDTVLFPSDFQVFLVNMELPSDAGLEATADASRGVDAILERMDREGPYRGQIEAWTTSVGVTFTDDNQVLLAPHIAQCFISLRQGSGLDPVSIMNHTSRMIERIRRAPEGAEEEAIADRLRRFQKVSAEAQNDGPPTGKPVAVRIRCDDLDAAESVAAEIKAALAAMPGVLEVKDNHDEGREEYRLVLNEPVAAAQGITFERAALTLAAANDGAVVSVFKDPGGYDDADVRVQWDAEKRGHLGDLLRPRLRAASGATVPLSAVSSLRAERSHAGIYRYDGRRTVLVSANIDAKVTTAVAVNEALKARFDTRGYRNAHPGVGLTFGGEFEETEKSFASLREAFLVALFTIYMLLAAQFRSYAQPLVVMLTVPFAYIGVILGLYATGNPFTVMAGIAMIGLAGMVVNTAIVLLEFVNQRRREGREVESAIREACRVRLRPILLTTSTTLAGLLPMAFGVSGYSKLWSPFAATICFGMAFSTALTLLVVPSTYLIVEDVKRWRAARRGRRLKPPGD